MPPSLPPVLVLAAGLGTRAHPLSAVRAKPAFPVAGVPLISRILGWLAAHGAREVVVNLHHRAETITRIVGDGTSFGLRVRYSWEWPLLGSGGGPARAFTLIPGDELLIVNGDTLIDCDPAALVTAHRQSGAHVTLTLIENPRPMHYGGVQLDADDRVTAFTPRGTAPAGISRSEGSRSRSDANWHFVGLQVANRDVFEDVSPDAPSESVNGIYRRLMRERPGWVRGWRTAGDFVDIGTPADYLSTSLRVAGRDGRCLIAPTADLDDSSRIERTIVWERTRIAAGAQLTDCVITDDVCVPPRARYHRAVLTRSAPAAEKESDGPVWAYDLDDPGGTPRRVS